MFSYLILHFSGFVDSFVIIQCSLFISSVNSRVNCSFHFHSHLYHGGIQERCSLVDAVSVLHLLKFPLLHHWYN